MPIPAIQPYKFPNNSNFQNTAIAAMQIKGQRQNVAAQVVQGQKKLEMEQKRLKIEQDKVEQEQDIERKDFILNILSGVNSSEDLEIARRQCNARYPEYEGGTNKVLSNYNPNAVRMIRESLRTETQRLKMEKESRELTGFGAGTMVYRGGKEEKQVPFAPPKPTAPKFEVFENKDKDQVYVEKGKSIPEGYNKVMGKGTQVTVQTGAIGKSTKTMLEKAVIEGTHNIKSFARTRKDFKPEYLTYFGKGEKGAALALDKLGLSTSKQKELIREQSNWFRQAKADFIAYRKWATGVAGGEKELKEIATSFPDPVKNSPEQYKANLDSIDETTKKILSLNKDFLHSGIDLGGMLDQAGGGSSGGTVIRFNEKGERIP